MGTPFMGVDIVGIGEDILRIAVIVEDGNFNLAVLLFRLKINGLCKEGILVFVQILDKFLYAPFKLKLFFFSLFLIFNAN